MVGRVFHSRHNPSMDVRMAVLFRGVDADRSLGRRRQPPDTEENSMHTNSPPFPAPQERSTDVGFSRVGRLTGTFASSRLMAAASGGYSLPEYSRILRLRSDMVVPLPTISTSPPARPPEASSRSGLGPENQLARSETFTCIGEHRYSLLYGTMPSAELGRLFETIS